MNEVSCVLDGESGMGFSCIVGALQTSFLDK